MPSGILVNVYKLIPTLAEEALSRAKLEREFEIAREVQERLFPQTFPKVAGVEMAAHCRPAQAVGGDYYELIDIQMTLSKLVMRPAKASLPPKNNGAPV